MSCLTPHRPAASRLSCASLHRSSLRSWPRGLAILAALGLGGCYTGPTGLPDAEPWDGGDSEGSGDDGGPGDDGQGTGDGSATRGVDAGDGGSTGGGDDMDGSDGTGDGTDGGTEGTGSGEPPPVDVPDNAYCEDVASWDPGWAQLELDVLALVNEVRASGANCGSAGSFGSAPPLTMHPALRCAARVHSKDMDERDFFDHTNPSGESPWDRMGMAGYSYSNAGENIAAGSPDAAGTMNQWMNSDGHCANIMNPDFEEIGVGYHPGGQYGHLWTQVFGAQ